VEVKLLQQRRGILARLDAIPALEAEESLLEYKAKTVFGAQCRKTTSSQPRSACECTRSRS